MEQNELIPHLFRTEYSKITSVICKAFGLEHIEIAEDIASDTFVAALETWPYKGIPEKPVAWLYAVAKNKVKNCLKRDHLFCEKIKSQLKDGSAEVQEINIDLTENNISDSQLQMLFAICHPSLSVEAQIGLALRILCGFSIDEIANAFLANKEAINKRLFRAKEKLRQENVRLEFPPEVEIHKRLDTVLTTLYLLYNEGYYSESQETILREGLCLEAMRLAYLLTDNTLTNKPSVNALLALMCFHASRFEARKNDHGEIVLYKDQDETLWNHELIAKGTYFFNQASQGINLSKYHLEAGIAYWHTLKADTKEKWENILRFHNQLLIMEYSPIAALNRTYALSRVYGKEKAIVEAKKLNLASNHFYYTLLGELYSGIDNDKAKINFQKALSLAKTKTDKTIIQVKIDELA